MLRVAPADCQTPTNNSTDTIDEDSHPMFVSPSDLNKHRDRTNFYLRMSEVVQENSSQVYITWVKWLRMQGHRQPATLEVTGSNPGLGKINLIEKKHHRDS